MAKPAQKRQDAATNPNTRSLQWTAMKDKWWLYNTCMAGTPAMRDASTALLPRHEGESQTRYNDRLQSAVFTNFVRLTVEFLVGKPFSEAAKFRENTPDSLKALESDIDGQGNDLTTVCMDFFAKGFGKAWSWVFVDFPETDGPQTLAQVQEKNLRPYWCVLPPDNVIADRGEIIEGHWAWTHVRIFDTVVEYNGFEEATQNYIRYYQLVNIELDPDKKPVYRAQVTVYKQKDKNKDEWIVITPAKLMSVPRIPLVKFMSNPEGDMLLEDLLWLNVKHWQSNADQDSCLVMARFPILAGAGVDDEKQYVIGPYELLRSADPQSKFYYVENSGSAIGIGDKDIQSLEDRMSMYGAQMLKKRPDRETATSRIVDETQNMAPLQIIVLQFMSALETLCDITLMWLEDDAYNDDQTYGIDINLDFALSEENQKQMKFMETARGQGDVSRKQFLLAGKELGYIPETFDFTANDTELAAEEKQKNDAEIAKQREIVAAKAVPQPTV